MEKNKLLLFLVSTHFSLTSMAMDPPNLSDKSMELKSMRPEEVLTIEKALEPFEKIRHLLDDLVHYQRKFVFCDDPITGPEERAVGKVGRANTSGRRFNLQGESWEQAINNFADDLSQARQTLSLYLKDLLASENWNNYHLFEVRTAVKHLITMARMFQNAYDSVAKLKEDYHQCRDFDRHLCYPHMDEPIEKLKSQLCSHHRISYLIGRAVSTYGLEVLFTERRNFVEDDVFFLQEILPKIASLKNIKDGEIIDFNGQMFTVNSAGEKGIDLKTAEIEKIFLLSQTVLADLMSKFVAFKAEKNDERKSKLKATLLDTVHHLDVFKSSEPRLYNTYSYCESGLPYFKLREAFDAIFFLAKIIGDILYDNADNTFCYYEKFTDDMWEEHMKAFAALPVENWSVKKSISNKTRQAIFNLSEFTGHANHHDIMGWLDDNIVILGAKPYEEHLEPLVNKKVGAVLSIVENNENLASTNGPVTPNCWQQKGIKQLQLAVAKSDTISSNQTDLGVEFIRWNLKNKRGVYIHCGSGRGRSPYIFMCFLIRYRNYTGEKAFEFVKERRPSAAFDNPKKIEALQNYEQKVKKYFVSTPSAHDKNGEHTWKFLVKKLN